MTQEELKAVLDGVKDDFKADLEAFQMGRDKLIQEFETRAAKFDTDLNALKTSIDGVSDRVKVLETADFGNALDGVKTMLEGLVNRVDPLEAGTTEALHVSDLVKAFENFAPVINVTGSPVEVLVPEAKQLDLTVLNATLDKFAPVKTDLSEIVKAIQEGFKTPPNITVKLETPAAITEALAAPQAAPDNSAEVAQALEQLAKAEAAIVERDNALELANKKILELTDLVQEVKKQAAALVFEQSATVPVADAPVVDPLPTDTTLEPVAPATTTKKAVK